MKTIKETLKGNKEEVYVDFPSNDATPVYNDSDGEYYETGYKYRIILSKDIGI